MTLAFRAAISLIPLPRLSARGSQRLRLTRMQSSVTSTAGQPGWHLLNYKYVPEILEKRGPYREAHLAGAQQQVKAGKILLAGAIADPVDGALFIWKNATKEEITTFVDADPYIKAGLVTEWSIRPWIVVAGEA